MPIWQVRDRLRPALKRVLEPDVQTRPARTVVCVEDDAEMIDLIRFILKRHGIEMVGALGGHQAHDTIRRTKPDLVLLDLMMPDVSGWEVYRQLRADEETKGIPVIVVTVLEQFWSEKRGLAPEDVDGYLVKPFMPRALVDEVVKTIERSAPVC